MDMTPHFGFGLTKGEFKKCAELEKLTLSKSVKNKKELVDM